MTGGWGLPTSAEIGGREYRINADFRDVLEVIEWLNNSDEHEETRIYVALSLFYERFEFMPKEHQAEAIQWMLDFISLGDTDDSGPKPKLFDWEQDRNIIVAEVNKVAGKEVRSLDFLHWWTFIGYFNCIGEGQLSMVVAIREKLQSGKQLEKYEREFYNKNRSRVDFKRKYTDADDEFFKQFA